MADDDFVGRNVMSEQSRELRDRAVWVLSRLSLVMLLAMMGALFMGSAAQGHASTVREQAPTQVSSIEAANPLGLVLVAVVVAVGLGILAVGAIKPSRRGGSRDLAELLRD